jgi:hypothetical protein
MQFLGSTLRLPQVAAVLVATLVLTLMSALSATAATCSSLLVIGARGSGEPFTSEQSGMGKVSFAAYQQIKARVPDAQAYGLPFRAVAVVPDTVNAVGSRYWPSVTEGSIILRNIVNQSVGSCPNQRIVLIGYSAGAHVIADTLPQFGVEPHIRSRINAILLFGEPRFNPDSAVDRGDYNHSLKGIFPSFGITSVRTTSSTWWPIARSHCSAGDFICNFSWSNYRECPEDSSSCGHFGYVSNGIAQSAGAWAGNMINPPAPPPTTLPRTGPVGPTTYTYQVYHTGGVGLKMRAGPGTGYAHLGTLPDGAAVHIVCQAHGQRVLPGSNIWNRLSNGAWVYDWYTSTPRVGAFSPPIPRC